MGDRKAIKEAKLEAKRIDMARRGITFVPVMIPAVVFDLCVELTAAQRRRGIATNVSEVAGEFITSHPAVIKGIALLGSGAMPKDTPTVVSDEIRRVIDKNHHE